MMSLTNAKLKLEYPSAENENAVDSPATTQPTTQPAKPRIRLWTKQSSETRNPNSINLSGNQSGDFVPPGTFSNNAVKKLFGTSDTATLYVEGLTCSGNVADVRLLATLYPDAETDAGARKMEDAVRLTAIKVNVDGLRVYDPKLTDAGSAPIKYKISGPAAGFTPRVELTVMDGTTEVACLVKKTDPGPAIGTEISKSWDGKWGKKKDGTDTAYKDKIADPKKYAAQLNIYQTSTSAQPFLTNNLDLYVVRLGITEISFASAGTADECYKLQYHQSKSRDDNADGISQVGERYPIPDAAWRMGDESSNSANVDITSGANKGLAATISPYTTETFFPPQDTGTSGAVENDSWNYPVCYKAGSKIEITARTSCGAYSQIEDRILNSNELGYSADMDYPINLYAQWLTKNPMEVAATHFNEEIDPDWEVPFVCKDGDILFNTVGKDNVSIKYTWKYLDKDGTEKDVPGYYASTHTVYRVIDVPHSPWDCSVDAKRPWVAALDLACNWASSATSVVNICNNVTVAVNNGASRNLTYDMTRGAGNYGSKLRSPPAPPGSQSPLHLANFLLLVVKNAPVEAALQDGPPANKVNCTDCGMIITTFSNILGANISLTEIDEPHALNEIIAIGQGGFGWPTFGRGFGYHAFASADAGSGHQDIWDACLKVGRPDPTVLDGLLPPGGKKTTTRPCGLRDKLDTPASFTAPTSQPGGVGNGTMTITKVYQEANHHGVVPATCTAVVGGVTFFVVNCDRNGIMTVTIPDAVGQSVNGTVSNNSVNIIDFTIVQGTNRYQIGDLFNFTLQYNFNEYRSSLAAPDWDPWSFGGPGRTPASTYQTRTFNLEE